MSKKREEGKVRFNIIDFDIIVIVIGCVVGVVIRFNVIDKLVLDTVRDDVRISFAVSGISPQIANSIVDGDEFFVGRGAVLPEEAETLVGCAPDAGFDSPGRNPFGAFLAPRVKVHIFKLLLCICEARSKEESGNSDKKSFHFCYNFRLQR